MAFDPATAVLNIANTLIDRLIPDKTQAAQAKAQLYSAELQGDIQNMQGQIQTNIAEAANAHVFVSGWRPYVGWACGTAFIYAYIVQPLVQLILVAFHSHFDPTLIPKLDMSEMMPVLLGMLGLGALRSYDKVNGTGNGH